MNYYCSGGVSSKGVLLCHSKVCLQVLLKEKDVSHKPLKVCVWVCVVGGWWWGGGVMCVHSNTTAPNQN